MAVIATCPDRQTLEQFFLGHVPEPKLGELIEHFQGCSQCVEALHTLQPVDTLGQTAAALGGPDEPDSDHVVREVMRRLRQATAAPTAGDEGPRSSPDGTAADATADNSSPAEHTKPGDGELDLGFLAPPQAGDEIGRLGPYRVLEMLGYGGMGVVFKAEDVKLQRIVALKAMKPAIAAGANAGKRFLREARTMAKIKHDHIATIYQVDEDRGVPYLAMEFLDGEPLDKCLKREGKLPIPDVLRIGREVAMGLAAAHSRGLIHRDIKPGNIWLEQAHGQPSVGFPRVKILDFGLARAEQALESQVTQQGVIVGTPAYMAPEQGKGGQVDPRADLFSLGCVLYLMTTGQLPFRGADSVSTLLAVAMEQPRPPRELNVNVPAALSDLIMRLLEKKPAQRPASSHEVITALGAMERERETERQGDGKSDNTVTMEPSVVHAVPESPRRPATRRRVMAFAAAAAAVLAGALVLRVATDHGELTITSSDPGVEITIKRNGENVKELQLKQGENVARVYSGDVEVIIKGANADAFDVKNNRIVLSRGDKKTVEIERRALQAEPRRLVKGEKDPDRRAAEYVLSIGSTVDITTPDGKFRRVNTQDDLPGGEFHIYAAYFVGNSRVDDAAIGQLKDLKKLYEVHLHDTRITDAALKHLSTIESVGVVNLYRTAVTDAGIEYLRRLPRLYVINLSHTKVTPAGLAHFKGDTRLHSAHLSGLRIGDETLRNLIGMSRLTVLALLNNPITDSGIKVLETLPKLTELNLRGTQVTAAGVAALQKALPNCKIEWDGNADPDRRAAEEILKRGGYVHVKVGVASIKIERPADLPGKPFQLTQVGLSLKPADDAFIEELKVLRNVTHVSSNSTTITDRSLATFGEMPTLYGVYVNNTKITDSGLEPLGKLTNLTELSANNTAITDQGAERISRFPKRLAKVGLTGTKITDAALAHFAKLPNLISVQVLNTKVTAAGVAALQKALPNCKIEWDGNSDPDRRAAEWAIALRGTVRIVGRAGEMTKAADLPAEPFKVSHVRINYLIQDADVACLAPLTRLVDVRLSSSGVGDAGLEYLGKVSSLYHLNLVGNPKITDAGLPALRDLKELDVLIFGHTKVSDAGLEHLRGLTRLQQLDLTATQVTDDGLGKLTGLKRLQSVNLRATKVTAAGVARLAQALPKCEIGWDGNVSPDQLAAEWALAIGGTSTVRRVGFPEQQVAPGSSLGTMGKLELLILDLSNNKKVSDAELANLKGVRSLTSLNLTSTQISDAGLVHVSDLQSLTLLNLSGTQVSDAGIAHLKALRKLQALHIPSTQVTGAGLVALKGSPSLTAVNANNTRVGDKGLEALGTLPNLNYLYLNNTGVTDAGLVHLRGLTKIRALTLHFNRLRDAGLAHLYDLKQLATLDLRETDVTAAGVAALQKALPKCKIEWNGGR